MPRYLIVTLVAISIIPATLYAKDAPPVESRQSRIVEDVLSCRKILGDAERLSCFDAGAATLAQARDQRTIVITERNDLPKSRRSLFGFAIPKIALFSHSDSEPDIVAIDARIASVYSNSQGSYMLKLDDGGLWRLMDAPRGGDPVNGEKIHIKRGALGSYFASINGRVSARIQRVQ